MPAIVTVAEADDHLRLDLVVAATSPLTFDDARVPGLIVKIDAAEAIILDYLKVRAAVLTASPATWDAQDLHVVRAAVLLMLSALWDDAPDRTVADYMKPGGTIPLLLARLRDPTLA